MSHFTVMVISQPGEDLDKQLLPFREFECSGENDEYVQDIDITEEARILYEEDECEALVGPEGQIERVYEDDGSYRYLRPATVLELKAIYDQYPDGVDRYEVGEFQYGGATKKFYNPEYYHRTDKKEFLKIFEYPDGYVQKIVPTNKVESFAEFVADYYSTKVVPFGTEPDIEDEHKYGYVTLNEDGSVEKVIRRTNPNKKWDWYSVGGRWHGYFAMKPGCQGELGRPGINRLDEDYEAPDRYKRADSARKGDIDFELMRNEAAKESAERYDRFKSDTEGLPPIRAWDEIREEYYSRESDPTTAREMARKEYWNQPAFVAMRADDVLKNWVYSDDVEKFNLSREEYVQEARDRAIPTYALLHNGQWHRRGDMGWFGMSTNEVDQSEWNREFNSLLNSLPDDTILTVVDCHI